MPVRQKVVRRIRVGIHLTDAPGRRLGMPPRRREDRAGFGCTGTPASRGAYKKTSSARLAGGAHTNWRLRHEARSATCGSSRQRTQNRGVGMRYAPTPQICVRLVRRSCRAPEFLCIECGASAGAADSRARRTACRLRHRPVIGARRSSTPNLHKRVLLASMFSQVEREPAFHTRKRRSSQDFSLTEEGLFGRLLRCDNCRLPPF